MEASVKNFTLSLNASSASFKVKVPYSPLSDFDFFFVKCDSFTFEHIYFPILQHTFYSTQSFTIHRQVPSFLHLNDIGTGIWQFVCGEI